MRYLTLPEVLELHRRVIESSGGSLGIRDLGALESAIAQPRMSFAGADLYPTTIARASALGFSLIKNRAFIDGNKRVGHASMEVFLMLNGFEIAADVDEQERIVLQLAASVIGREEFTAWLETHAVERIN